MIGQPSEEGLGGAKAMLKDGLYTRFPRPDFVLALHDNPTLAAGKVAWKEGSMLGALMGWISPCAVTEVTARHRI
jgi:hippurate hydrolase